MTRPIHAFKIGQQVYHHSGGLPQKRTGPYIIVGVVRRSTGETLYRIKSSSREQLAHPDELRLVLMRSRKASD